MMLAVVKGVYVYDTDLTERVYLALRDAYRDTGQCFSGQWWDSFSASRDPKMFMAPMMRDALMVEGSTDEATLECEVLKTSIVNPDLFQCMRDVFVDLSNPELLDPTGKLLYKIFNRLEKLHGPAD